MGPKLPTRQDQLIGHPWCAVFTWIWIGDMLRVEKEVEFFAVLLVSSARLLRHHTARTLDSRRFMSEGSKMLGRAPFFVERERQRSEEVVCSRKKRCRHFQASGVKKTGSCPSGKDDRKRSELVIVVTNVLIGIHRSATISKLISA